MSPGPALQCPCTRPRFATLHALDDDEEILAVGDHLDRWGTFAHDARPLLPTCASSPTRSDSMSFAATATAAWRRPIMVVEINNVRVH